MTQHFPVAEKPVSYCNASPCIAQQTGLISLVSHYHCFSFLVGPLPCSLVFSRSSLRALSIGNEERTSSLFHSWMSLCQQCVVLVGLNTFVLVGLGAVVNWLFLELSPLVVLHQDR